MHKPSQAMSDVFFALCKSVNTPKSLAAWLLFKDSNKALLDLTCDPKDYTDASSFCRDYLITSYISKYVGHDFGIDTKKVALQKFAASEIVCRTTNERFRMNRRCPVFPVHVDAIISIARRKISSVLGPFRVAQVNKLCKWGPGATYGIPSRRASGDLKHSNVPYDVTPAALPYFKAHIESDPHWFAALSSGMMPEGPYSVVPSTFVLVDGNRVVTVPKNSKTDRTIAAEPTGNSFLQQGVGRYIRRRLRSVGQDLDNQDVNKTWASLAHSLSLATLDLSAASDSIACELVYELLPPDWYLYLDSLRSRYYTVPERTRYEKFSSMGNAFTFELETLIFWGLAKACCEYANTRGVVSVYGDDIIIPQSVAPLVIEVLGACGFSTNVEKSFTSGRFFESCGGHYFDGFDVTPVFQKARLDSTAEFIRAANRLRRWAFRSGLGICLDPIVGPAWLALRRHALQSDPKAHFYCIPFGSDGDDGWLLLSIEWNESKSSFTPGLGFLCNVLRPRRMTRQGDGVACYALWHRRGASRQYIPSPYEASAGSVPVDIPDLPEAYGLVADRRIPRYRHQRTRIIPGRYFDIS